MPKRRADSSGEDDSDRRGPGRPRISGGEGYVVPSSASASASASASGSAPGSSSATTASATASDPNRPVIALPPDAAFVIKDEPFCFFSVNCDYKNSPFRKSISHIFGRNKKCTRNVPSAVWIQFCRKHYQRSRYRTQDYGRLQCELMILQIKRIQLWSDNCAEQNIPCRLIDWELTTRKRETKRLDADKKKKASAAKAAAKSATKKRARPEDDVDGDEADDGNESEGDDDMANAPDGCPAPAWLLHEMGKGLSTAKVLEIAEQLLTFLRMGSGDGKFPDIELLPNIVNDVPQPPRQRKAAKNSAAQSSRRRHDSHGRSNSESLHGDDYSRRGSLAPYSMPPHDQGPPSLGTRIELPCRPIGGVPDMHNPGQPYYRINEHQSMPYPPPGSMSMHGMASGPYFDQRNLHHGAAIRPKGHTRTQSEMSPYIRQPETFRPSSSSSHAAHNGHGYQNGYPHHVEVQHGYSPYQQPTQYHQQGPFQGYPHHDAHTQHVSGSSFDPVVPQPRAQSLSQPTNFQHRVSPNLQHQQASFSSPVSRHVRNASMPVPGAMQLARDHSIENSGHQPFDFRAVRLPHHPPPIMQHEAQGPQAPGMQIKNQSESPQNFKAETSPYQQNSNVRHS